MRLCKDCAVNAEEFYYFFYPFSKSKCECCHEIRWCFDVNTLPIGGCLV